MTFGLLGLKYRLLIGTRLTASKSSLLIRTTKMTTSTDIDRISKRGPGLLAILENSPKRLERIKFLGQLYEAGGHELRIAGGAVRDILSGVEPQDIDLATTAKPEQSLDILSRHEDLMRLIVNNSGLKHGTVSVKFKEADIDFKRIKLHHDQVDDRKDEIKLNTPLSKPEYDEESPFDITTLRNDVITDGRHAEVEFITDWKVDAERRDLTINAMFLTINDGKLVDYYGGESDLKEGIIRFVGDAELRLKEDYLRILRFFRFWSRYGKNKTPDPETTAIIKKNLVGLEQISGQRLWQEIKKILGHIPCLDVIRLMFNIKLFNYVGLLDDTVSDYSPHAEEALLRLVDAEKNIKEYSTTILPTAIREDTSNNSKRIKDLLPAIMFAALVQTCDNCINAHKRLFFSNIERDSILHIVENRNRNASITELKYQLALAPQPERFHQLQKTRALLIYRGRFDLIRQLDLWEVPNFPLTGNDVAQEFRTRKLPKDKIKTTLTSLKHIWATSDYQMTREQLEKVLKDKLEESEKSISD